VNALEPHAGGTAGLFDPALGRLPSAVTHALFRGDDWLATSDLSITTALEAAAPNTRIAWTCDWAVFRTWALGRASAWYPDERDRIRIPARPELLVRFVTDMLGGYDGEPARARATVLRYLSTLSTLHRLLDAPDPTKAAMVRNTVKAKTRGSGGQDQAAPFRWTDVLEALAALTRDPANLKGLRDAALLAVGHNTMARRAELVAIDVADLEFTDGDGALVMLRPTKQRLAAEPEPRYLAPLTADLLRTWMARGNIQSGPVFTRLRSNGGRGPTAVLLVTAQRLSAPEVNSVVKLAVARIAIMNGTLDVTGSDRREVRRAMLRYAASFSGHSLRVGAAQDLAAAGVSTAGILQAGGWKDERMIRRYLRKLRAREGGMAQFFGAGAPA
jgi:integrase